MTHVIWKNKKIEEWWNFAVNQERVDKKKIVASNSISEETSRSGIPVGTRPNMDFAKFTKIINNGPHFQHISSTINTPTYKTKFLVPILKYLTSKRV